MLSGRWSAGPEVPPELVRLLNRLNEVSLLRKTGYEPDDPDGYLYRSLLRFPLSIELLAYDMPIRRPGVVY